MENNCKEEFDAHSPQQIAGAFEKMRVRIDGGGPTEDEQIAEGMDDDEADSDKTGDSHDDFLADHGGVEAAKAAHPRLTALPRPSARGRRPRSSPGHRAPLG